MKIWPTSLVLATAFALIGCVSVAERKLPLAEVQGWRISEVKVEFAPDATVNLPNRLNNYVNREIKRVAPELEALPVDPANPDRNAYAEKAVEIASTPQAQSTVRIEGAEEVRQRYAQAFTAQPAGQRPVHMVVTVRQLAESGDAAAITAKTRFVDAKTGQLLMDGPLASAQKQSRPVFATSVAGLAAVVVVNAVLSAVEQRSGTPFSSVVDQSAVGVRTWLLKKEGE
jgi:hypothetical protein